ncbi:MAG: single-stranded DNA-binding protein [Candidatus Paceibacterota bacterium]|jgi:single-strand DNA-binding protein
MNINRVIITGNLTRDPELKTTPAGTTVCNMRVAVNDRYKDNTTGEWKDRPNYFDVDAFSGLGENCAKYLAKGSQAAIDGKLRWREWTTDDGQKRQAVTIVADNVQFLGTRSDKASVASGVAAFDAAGLGSVDAVDDDIPF